MTGKGRIDGWKEISSYIDKSIRTTQRFEEEGLPIHRLPGKRSVFAFKDELNHWIISDNVSKDPMNCQIDIHNIEKKLYTRVFSKGALAIIVIFCISLLTLIPTVYKTFFIKTSNDLHFEVRKYPSQSIVDIMNKDKDVLLSLKTHFPNIEDAAMFNQKHTIIKDINGDGLKDVIWLVVTFEKTDQLEFYIQKSDGSFTISHSWDLGMDYMWDKPYTSFSPRDMELVDFDNDGIDELALFQNSVPYYPAVFRIFELDGTERVRLFHPGHFLNVTVDDFDENGIPEFYFGGTNNHLADQASNPVFIKMEFTDLKNDLMEFSFFKGEGEMIQSTPSWLNVNYLNLKKDTTGLKVALWEIAFVPDNLHYNSTTHYIRVLASPTKYNLFGEIGEDGPYFNRILYFNKELVLKDAYYTEPYLTLIKKNLSDPDIQDILTPLYWNGKDWQETVCQIPQK